MPKSKLQVGGNEYFYSIFNPCYTEKDTTKIKTDLRNWTKEKTKEKTKDGEKEEILNYQDQLLEHSSYSPLVTYSESEKFVKKKEEGSVVAKNKFELQTRRACKFGLEYIAKKNKTGEHKAEIAFLNYIIDRNTQKTEIEGGQTKSENDYIAESTTDFVLGKTKSKNRPGGGVSSERVPITVSEQRKLYRIRSGFSGIKFIDRYGENVQAPWNKSSDKQKWNQYNTERLNKYKEIAKKLAQELPNILKNDDLKLTELKEMVINALKVKYPDLSPSEAKAKEQKSDK